MISPDKIRLAVVQPRDWWDEEAPRMLRDALGYIEEAGQRRVDLLLFPEMYPGPISHDIRYEVIGPLQEACARHGVAVAAGTSTPVPGHPKACRVTHVVIDAAGKIVGRYHRTHPRSQVYRGLYGSGGCANFEYTAADEFPVFDMGWGTIGISICSEMFVPEVARILALRGAEICLFPVGWTIDDLGWRDIWQTLVRARAIENTMFTAACQNLFDRAMLKHYTGRDLPAGDGEGLNRGLAIIAGPEGVLGVMPNAGILTADLDLARVRLMRRSQEFPHGLTIPPPFGTVPGVLALRRPELTAPLLGMEAATMPEIAGADVPASSLQQGPPIRVARASAALK
jgi:predicted amidohydrolase